MWQFESDHARADLIWNFKVRKKKMKLINRSTWHPLMLVQSLVVKASDFSLSCLLISLSFSFLFLPSFFQTREELREALENEMRAFMSDRVS